jgi:hypothetical protein
LQAGDLIQVWRHDVAFHFTSGFHSAGSILNVCDLLEYTAGSQNLIGVLHPFDDLNSKESQASADGAGC